MKPIITDDEVSRLPLARGRANVLEEIMGTTSVRRPAGPPKPPPGRWRGWAIAAAAVLVVVAVIAIPQLVRSGGHDTSDLPAGGGSSPAPSASATASPRYPYHRVTLLPSEPARNAPNKGGEPTFQGPKIRLDPVPAGWTLDHEVRGEVVYDKTPGSTDLDIEVTKGAPETLGSGSDYTDPGETVTVLGKQMTLHHSGALAPPCTDCGSNYLLIGDLGGGWAITVSGQSDHAKEMDRAAWDSLVSRLKIVP